MALENLEALEVGPLLERYQDLLKILPQPSNMSVNGSDLINNARLSLIDAIDDYIAASTLIMNDTDLEPGAEELIEIDECDQIVEEWQRANGNILMVQTIMKLKDTVGITSCFQACNTNCLVSWLHSCQYD